MTLISPLSSIRARLCRFRHSQDGGVMSIEMMLILPIMIWAYLGMMIFFDAFRSRTEAQNAALHVADLMSRQSETVTTAYLEGLNDVFDFLTGGSRQSRLRVSLVVRPAADQPPVVAWSYGTRGLLPLDQVADMLSLVCMGDPDGDVPDDPLACFDAQAAALIPENSGQFQDPRFHLPVEDLAQRISPVLPGESLIVVESFSAWQSPTQSMLNMPFLRDTRLTPVAVTRPRFSPFINYEGAAIQFDPDSDELPPVWNMPDPDPTDPDPDDTSLTSVIVDNDFSTNDTTGWSNTTVTHSNHAIAGSFLGPFGRETMQRPVTYTVNLGQETESARIEFDLLVIDSWDGFDPSWSRPEGENFVIQINGSSIAAEPFVSWGGGLFDADRRTVASRAEGRFTTTMVRTVDPQQMVGSGWSDQVWRVTIDIDAPVQNFTLGFLATLDEDVHNESFGLMNIRITAIHGTRNPQHYIPPANTLLGNDPLLRFPVHGGCPDYRQAAPVHTLQLDHIWDPLRHRVRGRGATTLRNCAGFNSNPFVGRIHATPTLVLDWTDTGERWHGSRLRIRTEDGNNGRSCDTTLLIRDPLGAWHFNDDYWGWNAGREMGWAPSGEYQIWVGIWGWTECNADIIIERY